MAAWDGDRIQVEARVWANARSEDRAEEIANDVEIVVDGGRIRSEGPRTGRREGWGVSFEVRVPRDIGPATAHDQRRHRGHGRVG